MVIIDPELLVMRVLVRTARASGAAAGGLRCTARTLAAASGAVSGQAAAGQYPAMLCVRA